MQSAGSCDGAESAAKRSYSASKVRGGRQKELSRVRGQGRRPKATGCDSAGAAERSYPHQRPGAVDWRSNPTSKERWLCGHRRASRSYPTLKVRKGGSEEIPLVQGKEQRSHFAGAAVKRYPRLKVRES